MKQSTSSSHTSQRNVLNQNLAEVQGQISISFEFSPLRTSEMERTPRNSINHLSSLKPKFVPAIYNVNPGERDRTHSIIKGTKDRAGLEAAPHLTCINAIPAELWIIACDYWNSDIRHIIALRGDLLPGSGKPEMYASDLVALLKEMVDFDISVAAYPEVHPEARSAQVDLLDLRREVGAGVNRATTQFFFDIESYLRFRDRYVSAGIGIGIIPGILPISSFKQTKKSAGMTSVRIPAWMAQMFDNPDDDIGIRKLVDANIAIDTVKILSHEGVKDFHFYTPNRAEMGHVICHTLGVRSGL